MRDRLKTMHNTVVNTLKTAAEFWQSSRGIAAIELVFVQSSRMMQLSAEVATHPKRNDGWADRLTLLQWLNV